MVPRTSLFRRGGLLLILALLVVAGCGQKNHPVKGKVTFKENGKPLGAGHVLFQLVSDPDIKASGDIEEDGSYELGNSKGMGALAGEYEVLVQPRMLENDPTKSPIDNRFRDFKTSGLKYTVKPGSNEFNIEVERPGKKK